MVMKVLVITGSPHKKGTSALLAEKFIEGATKTVIDRYHGIDDLIRNTPKKVLSIITAAYPEDWVFDGVKAVIKTTTRYLGWKDCGEIRI